MITELPMELRLTKFQKFKKSLIRVFEYHKADEQALQQAIKDYDEIAHAEAKQGIYDSIEQRKLQEKIELIRQSLLTFPNKRDYYYREIKALCLAHQYVEEINQIYRSYGFLTPLFW